MPDTDRSTDSHDTIISDDGSDALLEQLTREARKAPGFPDASRKICFFISTVKDEGSPERANSDFVYVHILKKMLESKPFNYSVFRYDQGMQPGSIPKGIIEAIISAPLAVVDLSSDNTNVGYEMGIRHAFQQPTLLMRLHSAPRSASDVTHHRYISYDPKDHLLTEAAKEQLIALACLLEAGQLGDPVNPVTEAANFQSLYGTEVIGLLKTILGKMTGPIESSASNQQTDDEPTSTDAFLEVTSTGNSYQPTAMDFTALANMATSPEMKSALQSVTQFQGWQTDLAASVIRAFEPSQAFLQAMTSFPVIQLADWIRPTQSPPQSTSKLLDNEAAESPESQGAGADESRNEDGLDTDSTKR